MSSCAELAVELAVERRVQVFLGVQGGRRGGSASLGMELGMAYGVWRMGPAVAGCGESGVQQRTYKFCKYIEVLYKYFIYLRITGEGRPRAAGPHLGRTCGRAPARQAKAWPPWPCPKSVSVSLGDIFTESSQCARCIFFFSRAV